jgi:hypothetical protein
MNTHTLTLLAVLAGSTALAQDYHPAGPAFGAPQPAVIQPAVIEVGVGVGVRPPCGPRPAPAQGGQWELRTTQQYVQGPVQQVYVPGQCYRRGHRRFCEAGRYVSQQLPGHYESRQEWVWVAFYNGQGYASGRSDRFDDDRRAGRRYGRRGF